MHDFPLAYPFVTIGVTLCALLISYGFLSLFPGPRRDRTR